MTDIVKSLNVDDNPSMPGIIMHKEFVESYMNSAAEIISERGLNHDNSKLLSPELEAFDKADLAFKTAKYGSAEYKAAVDSIRPAVEHHYKENSHHPEHYEDGIAGMSLFDLIEMVCDWKAASLRPPGNNLADSFEMTCAKYRIEDPLKSILKNTLIELGAW